MKYITTIDQKQYTVEVIDEAHVSVDGTIVEVNFSSVSGQPVYSLIVNGKSYEAYVSPGEDLWDVLLRGRLYPVKVEDEREKRLRAAGGSGVSEGTEFHLKAPMPGLVVAVSVEEGQAVEKGQVLVILESMKMQNELKSPKAGTVARVRVKPGETVEHRANLLTVV